MTLLIWAVLSTAGEMGMGQANYPAASMVKDEVSPGGFGTSENLPRRNDALTPKEFLTLVRRGETIDVTIANHENRNLWINAADSNLRGWLEAKVDGQWKAIEFHRWSDCGNSYHRVNLPVGYHWTFSPTVPVGAMKTEVRFALMTNQNRSREMEPNYSASISVNLDPGVFRLSKDIAAQYEIKTDWVVPTLMPKGF